MICGVAPSINHLAQGSCAVGASAKTYRIGSSPRPPPKGGGFALLACSPARGQVLDRVRDFGDLALARNSVALHPPT